MRPWKLGVSLERNFRTLLKNELSADRSSSQNSLYFALISLRMICPVSALETDAFESTQSCKIPEIGIER